MKKIIPFIIIILSVFSMKAQQDAMFTHYMFNTLAINPAYAGSRDVLTVTGLYRSQWVNFEGAPVSQTITAHTPIPGKNSGLGISFLNDKIGPVNTTSFNIDYSYRLKINSNAYLALGLKGGLNMMNNNLTELNIEETDDPNFMSDINSKLLPNFGFGIYYFTEKLYAGFSIPKLLENNYVANTTSGTTDLTSENRHYYLILGTVFNLTEGIKLKPTTFLKVTSGAPVEGDITTSFIFNDKFWAGTMFRTGDALGILAGVNISDQLALGYSFDWSYTNTTVKYNGGSHEIMLRYDFLYKSKKDDQSPGYF